MKEIKRYDYVRMEDWSGHSYYGLVEKPEGKWVLAEDYDALAAELQALKVQEAMQADRQYIAGLKAGWNFAQSDDEAGYACAVNGRRAEIHAQKGEAE